MNFMKMQLKNKKDLAEQEMRLLSQIEEWKAEVVATREEWTLKIEETKRILQAEKTEFEANLKIKIGVLVDKLSKKDMEIRKLMIQLNEFKEL